MIGKKQITYYGHVKSESVEFLSKYVNKPDDTFIRRSRERLKQVMM